MSRLATRRTLPFDADRTDALFKLIKSGTYRRLLAHKYCVRVDLSCYHCEFEVSDMYEGVHSDPAGSAKPVCHLHVRIDDVSPATAPVQACLVTSQNRPRTLMCLVASNIMQQLTAYS